ncbi:hypothetical protein BGX38DRAFT_314257 [Terfezia claveryi]|nr:hypothetical protein BGX38DRAFT_314257 [Terfezia claveryi]
MSRHRSSPPSTKHKSKSSSHEKHKKHKLPSTSISVPTSTSANKSSKPKRVSFGGVSSDNGPPTHSSRSSSTHHEQHHSKSKSKDHDHKHNITGKGHTTTKPHEAHSSTKAKEHSSAKSQFSDGNGREYKPYSSTSGILKSREKHPKRSTPSHSHKGIPHTIASSSIPKPTQRIPQKSHKKKPSLPPHPYSTIFSDSIQQRTSHLLTHLPAQLNSILTTILQSLSQINISPFTNEPYTALAAAHKSSILARYGNAIPLGVIRKFQADCKQWDRELKRLFLEHEGVQKELVELAREIGVGDDGNGGGASKQGEEDVQFEEMIKEIKQVGKTYVAKMDKLEKVCPSFRLLSVTDQANIPGGSSSKYDDNAGNVEDWIDIEKKY